MRTNNTVPPIVALLTASLACVAHHSQTPAASDTVGAMTSQRELAGPLTYSGSVTVIDIGRANRSLAVAVAIQNTSSTPVTVGVGGCNPPKLQVRPWSNPSAAVKWDERKWDNVTKWVCADVLFEHILAPTETLVVGDTVRIRDILGDSIPPARYDLSVLVQVDGPRLVPLGVWQLAQKSDRGAIQKSIMQHHPPTERSLLIEP